MRRFLFLSMVMCLFVGIAFAQDPTAVTEYEYTISNNSGTGRATAIPITSIRPNVDKITAYEVVAKASGNSETYIGVYDGTTVACSGEKFGEKEATSKGSAGERFERPKKIVNGVTVIQGANTDAIVYFIKE